GISLQAEPPHQRFEGSDQQRQRRAQLMADIGEEPVFDLVQLEEFLIAHFERYPVLIQLKAQGELAEAGAAVKIAASDGDNGRQHKEIEIVEKQTDNVLAGGGVLAANRTVGQTGAEVKNHYKRRGRQTFPEAPVQHESQHQQDQIQTRIIWRRGALGCVNHPGNERCRQQEQRHALEAIVLAAERREQQQVEQRNQQRTQKPQLEEIGCLVMINEAVEKIPGGHQHESQ